MYFNFSGVCPSNLVILQHAQYFRDLFSTGLCFPPEPWELTTANPDEPDDCDSMFGCMFETTTPGYE